MAYAPDTYRPAPFQLLTPMSDSRSAELCYAADAARAYASDRLFGTASSVRIAQGQSDAWTGFSPQAVMMGGRPVAGGPAEALASVSPWERGGELENPHPFMQVQQPSQMNLMPMSENAADRAKNKDRINYMMKQLALQRLQAASQW